MRLLIFNQTTEDELLSGTRYLSLPEASRPGGVCPGLPRPAAAGRNICRVAPGLGNLLRPGLLWPVFCLLGLLGTEGGAL